MQPLCNFYEGDAGVGERDFSKASLDHVVAQAEDECVGFILESE